MIRVKICGITNFEDADAACAYGADALGFVFADSPRRIKPEEARRIIKALPPFVTTVGVFVNEDEREIRRVADFCDLDYLQFHGDETPEFCGNFGRKIIKAFRVSGKEDIKEIEKYSSPDFILLDAYDKNKMGGTGHTFDWHIVSSLRRENRAIILSGGLKVGNLIGALMTVKPDAVDVCSGIEKSPGKKDHAKMKDFINLAKKALIF
ncbi:MAG: phosphoribosylanthranilate isomerase [Candidatus Aureabacteria bacterium]|nr:phosphoribosylanthranilate isomerase [Candidatus Auribacterota bacterium]